MPASRLWLPRRSRRRGNRFPAKNGPRSIPKYMVDESGAMLVDGGISSNDVVRFSRLSLARRVFDGCGRVIKRGSRVSRGCELHVM